MPAQSERKFAPFDQLKKSPSRRGEVPGNFKTYDPDENRRMEHQYELERAARISNLDARARAKGYTSFASAWKAQESKDKKRGDNYTRAVYDDKTGEPIFGEYDSGDYHGAMNPEEGASFFTERDSRIDFLDRYSKTRNKERKYIKPEEVKIPGKLR